MSGCSSSGEASTGGQDYSCSQATSTSPGLRFDTRLHLSLCDLCMYIWTNSLRCDSSPTSWLCYPPKFLFLISTPLYFVPPDWWWIYINHWRLLSIYYLLSTPSSLYIFMTIYILSAPSPPYIVWLYTLYSFSLLYISRYLKSVYVRRIVRSMDLYTNLMSSFSRRVVFPSIDVVYYILWKVLRCLSFIFYQHYSYILVYSLLYIYEAKSSLWIHIYIYIYYIYIYFTHDDLTYDCSTHLYSLRSKEFAELLPRFQDLLSRLEKENYAFCKNKFPWFWFLISPGILGLFN